LKILIVGDSFAARYNNGNYLGWSELLEQEYTVTNLAQAGVSEYKILKQIESVNLKNFDCVIISHTSPYRVHTKSKIHNTELHANCDLLLADIFDKWSFNPKIRAAKGYFKYHFDIQYYEDIYKLLQDKIDDLLKNSRVIDTKDLKLNQIFQTHRGTVQHLDEQGNQKMYNRIVSKLNDY